MVDKLGLDQAFGDVEVAGGGMDVIVGWIVGDVDPKVVEWAQKLLGEGALEFLAT